METEGYQITLYDLDTSFGKMSPAPSPPLEGKTSGRSLRGSCGSRRTPVMFLNLTPGTGNLLGLPYWEMDSAWLGVSSMPSTGEYPRDVKESSLSQILEGSPPRKYYLSRTACLGILRRAEARGKELPGQLKEALLIQAGIA